MEKIIELTPELAQRIFLLNEEKNIYFYSGWEQLLLDLKCCNNTKIYNAYKEYLLYETPDDEIRKIILNRISFIKKFNLTERLFEFFLSSLIKNFGYNSITHKDINYSFIDGVFHKGVIVKPFSARLSDLKKRSFFFNCEQIEINDSVFYKIDHFIINN